eukprot:TRINITY_DN54735_c0_g1_i1.p2 TRINITY_DN54735_c0_g1~~TRINITY_DN54735_c0_g1_i1.p2  ORF type:complete len:186 (+),score=43.01 TRINITY_DN54735_c0_g1_i1:75-632(+)
MSNLYHQEPNTRHTQFLRTEMANQGTLLLQRALAQNPQNLPPIVDLRAANNWFQQHPFDELLKRNERSPSQGWEIGPILEWSPPDIITILLDLQELAPPQAPAVMSAAPQAPPVVMGTHQHVAPQQLPVQQQQAVVYNQAPTVMGIHQQLPVQQQQHAVVYYQAPTGALLQPAPPQQSANNNNLH